MTSSVRAGAPAPSGIGETIRLTVMRSQRLLNLNIVPVENQEERWQLNENGRATPEQLQLKNAWLGVKQ